PTIGNHFSVRLLRPADFLFAATSGDVARLFAVRRHRQCRRALRVRIRVAGLTEALAAQIPQRGDSPRPAPHPLSLQFRTIFQHLGPPLRHLPRPPGSMISIIIPTLNEAKIIGSTLRTLAATLTLPHEVIVSDGGSSDRTAELAAPYATTVVVYSGTGRQTIGEGRNEGAKLAAGDFLVFLDA